MILCDEVLVNGRWSLLLPRHRAERPEWLIENGGWEPERLASMAEHLGPADVVYDIGAEQGDLPGLWSSWGCDVVLVEPNPLAWPNIRAVWEANRFRAPLAWWVGFASDREELPARRDVAHPFGLGVHGWPACADGEAIGATGFRHLSQEADVTSQTTIDRLTHLIARPPTAITIDVEGSELLVLRGAAATLDAHRPLVWVSVHTDRVWMDEMYGGVDVDDVHAFMAGHGYVGNYLATDHEEHFFFEPKERT